MLQTQKIQFGNRVFIRTYSDAGYTVKQDQTGREYASAIDLENSGYTYTETENLIEYDIPDGGDD
jgi:hypothetical protein